MAMGLIFMIVFSPVAFVFWYVSQRIQKKSGAPENTARPLAAAALPYVLLFYGFIAFIVYALICELGRGVDMGIGDGFRVPITNGYSLEMIDVTTEGFITYGGIGGRPLLTNVTDLAVDGDSIVLVSDDKGFIIDTREDSLYNFSDAAEALAQFDEEPVLMSVDRFYSTERLNVWDMVLFLLLLLPAIGIFVFWIERFIMAPKAYRRRDRRVASQSCR